MPRTPFPTNPSDVVALTVPEFTCELDLKRSASIDAVCQRFRNDTNKVLVWFIRFGALTAGCGRIDMAPWAGSEPHAQHACELAASFELNDDWEFDAERFRSAVESIAGRRGPTDGGDQERFRSETRKHPPVDTRTSAVMRLWRRAVS